MKIAYILKYIAYNYINVKNMQKILAFYKKNSIMS